MGVQLNIWKKKVFWNHNCTYIWTSPLLQTPSSLINWFRDSSFSSKSSRHLHSQTVRARAMSCVRCHVSNVLCPLSRVTSYHFYNIFFFKLLSLLVEGLLSTGPTRGLVYIKIHPWNKAREYCLCPKRTKFKIYFFIFYFLFIEYLISWAS